MIYMYEYGTDMLRVGERLDAYSRLSRTRTVLIHILSSGSLCHLSCSVPRPPVLAAGVRHAAADKEGGWRRQRRVRRVIIVPSSATDNPQPLALSP